MKDNDRITEENSNINGYRFEKIDLIKSVYSPRAHGDQEQHQLQLQAYMLEFFEGRRPIKMEVVGFPVNEDAAKGQQRVNEALLKLLNGKTELRVSPGFSDAAQQSRLDGSGQHW